MTEPDGAVSDTIATLRRVASTLAGGEERPGQLTMAAAVERAVADDRHLVVQAGTGTGKSLAYLVPLALSGRRAIVATATKALQDQLAGKDLPFLAEHLEAPLRFAVLKGRANYVCRQRLREHAADADQLALDGIATPSLVEEVSRITRWAEHTTTGDRADLDVEPSPRAWAAVSVSSQECPGRQRCPSASTCFAEGARDDAAAADVIVVNTHLLGLDLATGGAVLPEADVVVIDEAHRLEETVSATCGIDLDARRVAHLTRSLRSVLAEPDVPDAIERSGDRVRDVLADLVDRRLRRPDPDLSEALGLLRGRLADALAVLRAVEAPNGETEARVTRASLSVGSLAEDIDRLLTPTEDDVAWVEGSPEQPTLRLAPIAVAPLLGPTLFERASVILTSATIPPGLAETLGAPAPRTDELDVGSPFDYEANALLYCAAHLPDPRQSRFDAAVHDELTVLIEAAGGRTLALFTSHRAMGEAAEAVRSRLSTPVLTQGDLPAARLIEAFAGDEATSLFATMAYWQGIDVPGPSLSLLTIDRIPFPRPDEPLLAARRERAREAAFATIDLPRAATLLAQGSGRLIRSTTDRGVVAVFDPRLATQGAYRWALVRALPPMRRTRDRAEAEAYLRELTSTTAPGP